MTEHSKYPPLSDYALVSDCHCAALVSRSGSVDWCCMPRIDGDSHFGRLLDWDRGGCWAIAPASEEFKVERFYEDQSLVLVTEFTTATGTARLIDLMAMSDSASTAGGTHQDLHIRVLEGVEGEVDFTFLMAPRFDYAAVLPCIHKHKDKIHAMWGSNQGLVLYSDVPLTEAENSCLTTEFTVSAGDRLHFSIRSVTPEELEEPDIAPPETAEWLDRKRKETLSWWRDWYASAEGQVKHDEQTLKSALILKGLTVEQTGAIVAAATTSLPEQIGGCRNWDYRYSWIRDSVFTARALHELGFMREADRFASFIERSAAGNAEQLQVMFGVDGKRRLAEAQLDWLEGYQGSAPVRIGNQASQQLQHDAYGELLELAWIRHCHGGAIDERRWRFLRSVVEVAAERWQTPDFGIWEVRNGPRHFVFSKAMCWRALDRGIALVNHYGFEAPLERWHSTRDTIRADVFQHGYDARRGIFRQAYDSDYLDSSLLLLPWFGFIDHCDPRMVRTADALCEGLDQGGLLLRYNSPDGFPGMEGAFLPSTFWLVDCLANQNRLDQAHAYYTRATACANDLGLFSEGYDPENKAMLGNIPQGLTHVSQIVAYLTLAKAR
jgi:GH15 family glucan-1,4-alpha-glucosidase